MLAKTGVTKAGFLLLKQQGAYPKSDKWKSYFVVLNDHTLSYCSESHNFERPEDNVLLTSGTRVYHDDAAIIRIESGVTRFLLKGKDDSEMAEWMRAISCNVVRLSQLARGHLGVKGRRRFKELFLMLHRECITIHPSLIETIRIIKIHQLTTESSVLVKDNIIEIKSGMKGVETLVLTANSDIEHKHWCYALDVVLARVRKEMKIIVPPPHFPVHSGTLLYFDRHHMKWKNTYVVMTEDCIFFHEHHRTGFGNPLRYSMTPNAMIFVTTLNEHSFELVLFSDSIHLSASTDSERREWLFLLEKLIPQTKYDVSNPLQMASLEKDVEVFEVEIHSESSAGIGVLLEQRGIWAIATLVSESLSRKVCPGSVLSAISGQPTLMMGFEKVVSTLALRKPPFQLEFKLSPRKMGWLMLMINEKGRRLSRRRHVSRIVWEKVYATLSSGSLTLFTVKRDGKSKKRSFGLYGSAVGLVESNVFDGSKNCFRVLDGLEFIVLQAESLTSQMEWSIAIAHSISMENGGGILFDREKMEVTRDKGFGLQSARSPKIDDSSVTHEKVQEASSANFAHLENDDLSLPIEHCANSFFDAHLPVLPKKAFPVD